MTDDPPASGSPAMRRIRVRLPTTFATRTGGLRALVLEAETVGAGLRRLTTLHPDLTPLIWLNGLTLNPVIMIFHNEALIRDDTLETPVVDGDIVDVVPAVESG